MIYNLLLGVNCLHPAKTDLEGRMSRIAGCLSGSRGGLLELDVAAPKHRESLLLWNGITGDPSLQTKHVSDN
jgi:hypothetical protein